MPPLDTAGLTPLDTTGTTQAPAAEAPKLDVSGLKPLNVTGLSPVADEPAPAQPATEAAPHRLTLAERLERDRTDRATPSPIVELAKQAALKGAREGLTDVSHAPTAFTDRPQAGQLTEEEFNNDEPTPEQRAATDQRLKAQAPDAIDKILQTPLKDGWDDPAWWTAHMAYGAAKASPSLAVGVAGGVAGSRVAGPTGAVVGSAAGFGLGSMVQEIAPAYQRARAEGLDHEAAVDRAMKDTGIAGAFGTVMGVAPGVNFFGRTVEGALRRPISEALTQIFVAQPALGAAQHAATNAAEGKPTTAAELAEDYAVNAGTGAAMVGAHHAITALGGATPTRPHDPRTDGFDPTTRGPIVDTDFTDVTPAPEGTPQLPAPGPTDEGGGAPPAGPPPVEPEPTVEPAPANVVHPALVAEEMNKLTPEDRASPIPDDLIAQGRAALRAAAGEGPAAPAPTPAAPTVGGFRTAQGSTYGITADGQTIRTKNSSGRGQGTTYEPHNVLYVEPEVTQALVGTALTDYRISIGYSDGTNFVPFGSAPGQVPAGGTPMVLVQSRQSGKVVDTYPASTVPSLGLHPIEKRYDAAAGTSSTHLGNQIVEMIGPDGATTAVHPAPEAPAVAAPPAAPPGAPGLNVSGLQRVDDGSLENPVTVRSPADLEHAVQRVDRDATRPQAEAENHRMAHVRIPAAEDKFLDVSIHRPKGSIRTGTSASGVPWQNVQPAHYGYIKRTEGGDKENFDVSVGHGHKSFIVDQHTPETGKFDEHKGFVNFGSRAEAIAAYDANFSDGSGPSRRRGVTELTNEQLHDFAHEGDTSRPYAPQVEQNPERAHADMAVTLADPQNRLNGDQRRLAVNLISHGMGSDEAVARVLAQAGTGDVLRFAAEHGLNLSHDEARTAAVMIEQGHSPEDAIATVAEAQMYGYEEELAQNARNTDAPDDWQTAYTGAEREPGEAPATPSAPAAEPEPTAAQGSAPAGEQRGAGELAPKVEPSLDAGAQFDVKGLTKLEGEVAAAEPPKQAALKKKIKSKRAKPLDRQAALAAANRDLPAGYRLEINADDELHLLSPGDKASLPITPDMAKITDANFIDSVADGMKWARDDASKTAPTATKTKEATHEPNAAENKAVDSGNPVSEPARVYQDKAGIEAAIGDGSLRSAPERAKLCYKFAGDEAIAGAGDFVIATVGSPVGRIFHAVVENEAGNIYDPQYNAWFTREAYSEAVDGMIVLRRMTGQEVQAFGIQNGKYPSPTTLNFDVKAADVLPEHDIDHTHGERVQAEADRVEELAEKYDFETTYPPPISARLKALDKEGRSHPYSESGSRKEQTKAVTDESLNEIQAIYDDISHLEESKRLGIDPPTGEAPRGKAGQDRVKKLDGEIRNLDRRITDAVIAYAEIFGDDAGALLDREAKRRSVEGGPARAAAEAAGPATPEIKAGTLPAEPTADTKAAWADYQAAVTLAYNKAGDELGYHKFDAKPFEAAYAKAHAKVQAFEAAEWEEKEAKEGATPSQSAENGPSSEQETPNAGDTGEQSPQGADQPGDAGAGAGDVRASDEERPAGSGVGQPGANRPRGPRRGKQQSAVPDLFTAGLRPLEAGVEDQPGHAGLVDAGAAGGARLPRRKQRSALSTDAAGTVEAPPNYSAPVGGLRREGSWRATAERNLDAVELVHRLEEEKRLATPEEQTLLASFTGWGASEIRNNLFRHAQRDAATGKVDLHADWSAGEWKDLIERAQRVMSSEELQTALQSVQYAHYTSEPVVRSIWKGVERLGFAGGRILEPGMGIGLFPIAAPTEIMAASDYTGVEYDKLTAAIAQRLLPREKVIEADFVRQKLPDGFFDMAIGNPPFARTVITDDPAYRRYRFSLHDYFFAKSIDKVRPGGVLVFVTSRYTMDKMDDKARSYLAERADLLGAVRLPQTAFKQNAGTEVITDVLFLQRRTPGQTAAGQSWKGLTDVKVGEVTVPINEYFAAHPEMVLGEHATERGQHHEEEYTVTPRAGDIEEHFAKAVESLPKDVYVEAPAHAVEDANAKTFERDFNPSIRKEGGLYLKDGDVMVVKDGSGVALESEEKLTPREIAWFKDYVPLRDAVKLAQADQLNEGDWEKSLAKLNKAYDAFIATHGPINEFTTFDRKSVDDDGHEVITTYRRFKNQSLWETDVEGQLLPSLERITEDGQITKGPFFSGRTLKKPSRPQINTTQDALLVSLDEIGRLDLSHVAKLIGMTRDEAIKTLGDAIYETPQGAWQTADEYLSGFVVDKLEEAKVAADADPRFERNVKALSAAQPKRLGATDITVSLGAGWVAPGIVEDFAKDVLELHISAQYEPSIGKWALSGGAGRSARNAESAWGTLARSPYEILDAVANNREIKVTYTDSDKKVHVDQEQTAKANEVAGKMRDEFRRWVWKDAARAGDLVETYNRKFNNIAPRKFDGSHLTLPGLSLKYSLFPHQKRAIWRIVQTGNTYLAHAVGAGKTLEMIVSGQEQRRLGLIQRPIYAVPNHMLNQFAGEFLDAYPTANIMVASDRNFHTTRRQRFVAQAALNDPDAIIMTHSSFGLLGTKPENRDAIVNEIIAELEAAMKSMGSGQETRITRSKLEQQIEAIKRRFEGKTGAEAKDQGVMFEDMGGDFLYVDEAHEFRKLDFVTEAGTVKGIDPKGSGKALDLYIKTKYLESLRPGRSTVFASGTPVTNTMAEIYTVMRYMDEAALVRDGLKAFDAWSSQFGEIVPNFEQNAAGKYEIVKRFSRFVNVPELMKRVRSFMDVLTSTQLGDLVKRPDVSGGGPQSVVVQASPAVRAYMEKVLLPRIKTSREWKPSPSEPGNPDPLINIITDGRLSAIDMRFVTSAKDDPTSKLNQMIDRIIRDHKATAGVLYIDPVTGKKDMRAGSTQIVFSAVGFGEMVALNRGFDVRAFMMKRFAEGGIKASEVAWMSDYNTDAKKQAMFKEMRQGTKRILIGSPKNMGTGINVQKRLKSLHFLSPPWYPSDVEQPHGRIVRQGNANDEVDLNWYATKGTYDSTAWGMVARKARFIEQAFSGDDSVRKIEDITEASQYQMASALAAGDERAIQLVGLQADIERLERLQAAHSQEQSDLDYEARSTGQRISSLKSKIQQYTQAEKALTLIKTPTIDIDGHAYEGHKESGSAILLKAVDEIGDWKMKEAEDTKDVVLGTLNGQYKVSMHLSVFAEFVGKDKPRHNVKIGEISVSADPLTFSVQQSDATKFKETDPTGFARRVIETINRIPRDRSEFEDHLEDAEGKLARVKKRIGIPFEHTEDLNEKIAAEARLKETLAAEGQAVPDSGLPSLAEIERFEDEGGAVARDEGDVLQADPTDPSDKLAVAWHGSPHEFDQVDLSRVGTGEGVQAYGWGFYAASKRDVAEHYRNKLSQNRGSPIYKGKTILNRKGQPMLVNEDWRSLLEGYLQAAVDNGETLSQFIAHERANNPPFLKRVLGYGHDEKFSKFLEEKGAHIGDAKPGRLYKLELSPNEDEYLDWDKPLDQQSEHVKAALAKIPEKVFDDLDNLLGGATNTPQDAHDSAFTGRDLYKMLVRLENEGPSDYAPPEATTSKEAISKYLLSLGIPGIRYLDGSSRRQGDGTSNYVLFDASKIKIEDKLAAGPARNRAEQLIVEDAKGATKNRSFRDFAAKHGLQERYGALYPALADHFEEQAKTQAQFRDALVGALRDLDRDLRTVAEAGKITKPDGTVDPARVIDILEQGKYDLRDLANRIRDARRRAPRAAAADIAVQEPAARRDEAAGENQARRRGLSPEEIHSALRAELDRLGLRDIKLDVRDFIPDRQGNATSHKGRYRGLQKLIQIAMKGDLRWTLDHEIIHALRDLGVIRDLEWRVLVKAATADKAKLAALRNNPAYANLSEDGIAEEAVADLHADMRTAKDAEQPKGFLRTAWERIRKFFEALRNAFRGLGFTTAEDIFSSIDKGEVGARERPAEEGARSPADRLMVVDEAGRWMPDFEALAPAALARVAKKFEISEGTPRAQVIARLKSIYAGTADAAQAESHIQDEPPQEPATKLERLRKLEREIGIKRAEIRESMNRYLALGRNADGWLAMLPGTKAWKELRALDRQYEALTQNKRDVQRDIRRARDGDRLAAGSTLEPRQFGVPAAAGAPISSFKNDQEMKANPDYRAAKTGDVAAAARMVTALVKPETVHDAAKRFGPDVVYAPVLAIEAGGYNAIPKALADFYATSTDAAVTDDINQVSKAFHTGAKPMERIISRPTFDGPVEKGKRYVLVDDVTVLGGSLAELANHIRSAGGEVAGMVTLVNASRSGTFTAKPLFTKLIENRFGQDLRSLGIEPAALTADEAQYLVGFRDADQFRAARAKAESGRIDRLQSKGVRVPEASQERLNGPDRAPDQSDKLAADDGVAPEAEPYLDRAAASLDGRGATPLGPSIAGVPLPFQKDLGTFAKLMVHPRTIAALYRHFTPVWNAGVSQFAKRDRIAARLIEIKRPYDNLSRDSMHKVNQVLELGRLQGSNFKPDRDGKIRVMNQAGHVGTHPLGASLSRMGDEITLEPWEVHGYQAVRKTMNKALDLFRDQVVKEFGFKPHDPDAPTTAIRASEMAEDAEKAGDSRESERLGRLANVLGDIEQARRSGYVPFSRYGQWSVSVRGPTGDTVYREHFEHPTAAKQTPLISKIARKRAQKAIGARVAELERLFPQTAGNIVRRVEQITPKMIEDIPSMADLNALLTKAGLDVATTQAVQDAVAGVIQRKSFRKHFIQSRNIPGYSTDFERTLADYVTGLAGYLGRRDTKAEFDEAIAGIPAKQPKLMKYAKAWHDYIESPSEEYSTVRQVGFFMYLAGRLSSALINTTQVPLFTMPYLSQFVNPATVNIEIARAYKDVGLMLSVDAAKKLTLFDPNKAPLDVRPQVIAAIRDGTLLPLETLQEMAKANSRTPKGRDVRRKVNKVLDLAAIAFTGAERLNRIVSFIAAVRLAQRPSVIANANRVLRDNDVWGQNEHNQTPEGFGKWVVDETHFVMGKLNRPTMMRGIGAWILQFKSYTLNSLEMQWRMILMHRGWEGKAAAAAIGVMLILSGGLWGLPGAEDLRDLVEALYRFFKEKDIDLDKYLHEMFGGSTLGRIVAHGALRESGVDVSHRIGMGSIIPRPGMGDGTFEKLAPLLGMPGSYAVRGAQFAGSVARGDALSAAGAALPEALADIVRAEQMRERGTVARGSGRKMIDKDQALPDGTKLDDTTNMLKRALGFQPTGVARAQEAYSAVERQIRGVDELRRRIYTQFASAFVQAENATSDAERRRLDDDMDRMQDEVDKHNDNAPDSQQIEMYRTTQGSKRSFSSGLQSAIDREREGAIGTQDKHVKKKARGEADDIRSLY